MSRKKQSIRVVNVKGAEFVLKRDGYGWRVNMDDSELLPLPSDNRPVPTFDMFLESWQEQYKLLLRKHRIFDWQAWQYRPHELDPEAAACVDAVRALDSLRVLFGDTQTERESLVVSAMNLGTAMERVRAQAAWAKRNPPPLANATRKAKADARRESMADFIRDKGERPDTRPGDWYKGFRKAYPNHAVGDKTLKDDYPHALALLRKQAEKGSTERS